MQNCEPNKDPKDPKDSPKNLPITPVRKYEESPKHHQNSKKGIGKPPKNGQKALDESVLIAGFFTRKAYAEIAVKIFINKKMNITKYEISNNQYLKINPDECIHEDKCQFCTEMDIDYIDEKNNLYIKFGYEFVDEWYAFFIESNRIEKLLKGEMVLSENIVKDVGFEWNEYFAGKRGPTEADQYFWISNSPKEIRPYYNSWLYNDEKWNVIFEITPFYPWHNETKKTYPEKISYKEWIKSYKPLVKTIIPKENLKQWIKQANEFGKKYKVKFD